MIWKRAELWITVSSMSLVAFGQIATAPIPDDPLEVATGQIQPATTAAQRSAAFELLNRARSSYELRSANTGYTLDVAFKVDSGGETQYDGTWQMQDVFDPKQGMRWTAKLNDQFSRLQISANGKLYAESTISYIPLRLHEARASLLGPIPTQQDSARDAVRTSTAMFRGVELTCVLLSSQANGVAGANAPTRRWDETEECIDARSGLLRIHSQAPGRYYAYDYSNALQFAGHTLARSVIITEGGKTVSEILVQRLTPAPAADPNLFAVSDDMKARGRAASMAGAMKYSRASGSGPVVHTVCVFGLVTASGELMDAHSLQPSDPNSAAAVNAVKQMKFAAQDPAGAPPQQHLIFVVENFASTGS
jgi:hypothetical protein